MASENFRSSPSTQKFEQKGTAVQYPKITSIFDFSAEALGQISLWLEQNPPVFPITSIIGFSQFTVQASTFVSTQQGTGSTSYVDLGGPSLTGLSDGKYLVICHAVASSDTAANAALTSPSVNGSTPNDGDAGWTENTNFVTVTGLSLQTLSKGGNNTITAKYKVVSGSGANGSWKNRQLFALRYSNP